MKRRWTALVLAGSRPGVDPFARAYGTDLKALIPINGTPMVRLPVEALLAAPEVGEVRVLAQQPERLGPVLPKDTRLSVEASGATIAATLEAILTDKSTQYPLLITTADHAFLDPQMIAEFCTGADGADVAVGLVEKATLTALLPDSKRTWIRFRRGAYSGANLFALGSKDALRAVALWREVEQDRKKGWRMLAALGPLNLVGALLRLRSLSQVMGKVSRKLGLDLRAVEMSDPLAAVDVDKPSDHALVSAILKGRK